MSRLTSQRLSDLLRPLIERACPCPGPFRLGEQRGIVAEATRRIEADVAERIYAQMFGFCAEVNAMASLGLCRPTVPPPLPPGEALLWTDKGEPVRFKTRIEWSISADELDD